MNTRGARLGKYSLVAEIARGGMGIVYLAQAKGPHGFKKLVVVKLLKPELAEDDKFRDMFLDEARLAARLNHRNIVQTHEVDQDGDRYFFVMEYLEGRTLHAVTRLKGEKALPVSTLLRVISDVLAGLHYAHELNDFDGKSLGIVHRDVSPRNVFLTYDGQVKLLDFGVAKSAGRSHETEAGELKGRVPYMAPEHVIDRQIDRRADVFSAGVLLREALTGTRVWEGHREVDILKELLQKNIPPIPADAKISAEERAIIEKAMAPERDARYRTAHEMRVALERYLTRVDLSGSFSRMGEHISREFAEHRSHVRAMIEQHVALAESIPPMKGDLLPALPMSSSDLSVADPSSPSAPSNPSHGSDSGSGSSKPTGMPPSVEAPVEATASAEAESVAADEASAASDVAEEPGTTDAAEATAPDEATETETNEAAEPIVPAPPTSAPEATESSSAEEIAEASEPEPPLVPKPLAPKVESTKDESEARPAARAPEAKPAARAPEAKPAARAPEAKSAASAPRPAPKDISLPPPAPKTGAGTYVLVTLGFLAVVAGLTVALLKTSEPDQTTSTTTSETSTPTPTGRPGASVVPTASAPVEDDRFEVTLRASPPVAELWVDDVNVGQGPHTAKYKRGSTHVVRAMSPGYLPRTETLTVTAMMSMNLVLEREAGAAPVVVPHPGPHRPNVRGAPPAPPGSGPTPVPTAAPEPEVKAHQVGASDAGRPAEL